MAKSGKNRLGGAIITAFAAVLATEVAVADPHQSTANQRGMLPGVRAALMGGAFTALSDDASGGYYNPAGLSFAPRARVEASATAYRSAALTYKRTVNDASFDERSSTIYPSFIGGTANVGPLTAGFSYLALDARNIYQQNSYEDIAEGPAAAATYSRTYQEASTYNWMGGSLALKLGSYLSLGGSAFYYQRNIEFTTTEMLRFRGGGVITVHDTLKTLNTGIAAVYGVMLRGPHLSLGMSARFGRALSDRSWLIQDQVAYDPGAGPGQEATVATTRQEYPALNEMTPPTYSLGLAWLPRKGTALSADAVFHDGVRSPYRAAGGHDLQPTMNYSAGVMTELGPLRLMAGWFTNHSLYRNPADGLTDQPTAVDYLGYSAGMGWSGGGLDGQIGCVRQAGRGSAQIRRGDPAIQEAEGTSTTWLISGKVPL